MGDPVGWAAGCRGSGRAFRAGDAAGARRAFESALVDPASGDVIEGLARASYLELDFAAAIAGWERAYAAHREGHDRIGAVRVARTLAYMYGSIVGDGAVMGGWLARAQTLLGGDSVSGEAGWVSLNIGMWEGDRTRREARFREALDVGRRVGDDDLEFVAWHTWGQPWFTTTAPSGAWRSSTRPSRQ